MENVLDHNGHSTTPTVVKKPPRSLWVLSVLVLLHWTTLILSRMTLLQALSWGIIHPMTFLMAWASTLAATLVLRHHPDQRLQNYGRWFLGATCFTAGYIAWILTTYPLPPFLGRLQSVVEQAFIHMPLLVLVRYWGQRPHARCWWRLLEHWGLWLMALNGAYALWQQGWVAAGGWALPQILVEAAFGLGSLLLWWRLRRTATPRERGVGWLLWLAINLILLAVYQEGRLNHLEELLVLLGGILGLVAVQHGWQETELVPPPKQPVDRP